MKDSRENAAAPPPAAARGDVRGSRKPSDAAIAAAFWEHRARENSIPAELCDAKLVQFGHEIVSRARVLEPSLAAEGVQAGEVEIGYGWELDRYGFPNAGASQPAPFIDGYWTPWHIAQRRLADALSLSQQPEARGVVDEDYQYGLNFIRKNQDAIIARCSGPTERHVIERTFAALTGERNG